MAGPVADPRPDPTGCHIAYVSRGALRVAEANGSGDRSVAEPDTALVEFGTAVHTGSTSLDGTRGHWWSPDGGQLLFARTDFTPVQPWPTVEPAGAPTTRAALAGTPNPDVTLWLSALDGPPVPVSWDRRAFEYVVGAGWDAHGPWAVVQSRDQRTVRFLEREADKLRAEDVVSGRFEWNSSGPIVAPVARPDDPCISVKDPSIVRFEDRWH